MSVKELIFNKARWLNIDAISYPQDCVVKRGTHCFTDFSGSHFDILTSDRKGKLVAINLNFHAPDTYPDKISSNHIAFVILDFSTGSYVVFVDLANVAISGGKAPL